MYEPVSRKEIEVHVPLKFLTVVSRILNCNKRLLSFFLYHKQWANCQLIYFIETILIHIETLRTFTGRDNRLEDVYVLELFVLSKNTKKAFSGNPY